jgi:hypothetical protein
VSGLAADSPTIPFLFTVHGLSNGSAITGLYTYMLDRFAPFSHTLGDTEASTLYLDTAAQLREALDKELWSDQLGTYSLSTASPSSFSYTGIALSILTGAADATQAASSITELEELHFAVGYRTIPDDKKTDNYKPTPNLFCSKHFQSSMGL